MLEPMTRELSEKEFNRVNKGGLYITKGEMKGMGVVADFGAKVDVGKGSVSCELDFVEEMGSEGSDEVVRVLAEVGVFGEEVDEISN